MARERQGTIASQMHHHFQTGQGERAGAVDVKPITGVPVPQVKCGSVAADFVSVQVRSWLAMR
jgi:hypothetical protein